MFKRISIIFFLVTYGYSIGFFNPNITDFLLINADVARDNNITGKNMKVGVIDGAARKDHPSLDGQIENHIYSQYDGKDYTPDFSKDTHGSHVTSIIVGKKITDDDPYGLAYDAKSYNVQITGNNTQNKQPVFPKIYDYFVDNNVKSINNSWNSPLYPLIYMQGIEYKDDYKKYSSKQWIENVAYQNSSVSKELSDISRNNKAVVVFASGNEGMISPGIYATLPSYDESLKSWLVVGAVDSANISQQNDKLILKGPSVESFSNGFKGASNYALMAPGSRVTGANASYNNQPDDLYTEKSGTSQATPYVTASATLVVQKFPFLKPNQVADVILSTANKDFQAPKVILKETDALVEKQGQQGQKEWKKFYTVFYVDNDIPLEQNNQNVDKIQVREDLLKAGYQDDIVTKLINNQLSTIDSITPTYQWVQKVNFADIFGQGILDLGKAMGGLSILDANRLSDNDVKIYEKENQAAYYTLDLENYNATFSNDITQRKWEQSTHLNSALNLPQNLLGLNVGLIKNGSGTLTMSGKNNYLGATIIREGGLKLTGSLASNTYVENTGFLSGNGTIQSNLYNSGIVRPGNEDLTDLTVNGEYLQTNEATLILDFGNDRNSRLLANSYYIQGGNLQYYPLTQFYVVNKEMKIDLGDLSDHLKDFSNVSVKSNNAIDFDIVLDSDKQTINKSNSLVVIPVVKPDIYNGPVLNIRTQNLNSNYMNFFQNIENADRQTFVKSVESINANQITDTITKTVSQQQSFAQSSMVLAMNPAMFNTMDTIAHFKQEPTYFAYSGFVSDVAPDMGLIESAPYIWYLAPDYKRTSADKYSGYNYGLNLAFGGSPKDYSQFTFNFNFLKSKLDFKDDLGNFESKYINLSANYIYDFEIAKLISGAGIGFGGNKMNRNIIGVDSGISSNYNSRTTTLQIGLAKDFVLNDSFTLTPLVYTNGTYLYQNSFKEHGLLFAREYKKISHFSTSLSGGIFGTYNINDGKNKTSISAYTLYERRISGKTLKNDYAFVDFANIVNVGVNQNLNIDLITLGVIVKTSFENGYFTSFGISGEHLDDANNVNFMASFGKRF